MTATVAAFRPSKRKPAKTPTTDHQNQGHAPGPGGEGELLELDVTLIDPDPDNRAAPIDDALIDSVHQLGVLQPILVRPGGPDTPESTVGRYLLVAGERRWRAALAAGRTTIPAVVRAMTADQAAVVQIVENLRRRDLTPSEECRAIARCTTLGLTAADIAERLGATPAWVRTRTQAMTLPPVFLERLDTGDLTWDSVTTAASLPTEVLQELANDRHISNHAINRAADREKARKKANTRIKALERKGVHVTGDTKNTARVSEAVGWDNTAAHEKEPCHAVYVGLTEWGSVDERAVCTTPARHDPTGPSTLKRPKQRAGADAGAAQRRARIKSFVEWGTGYLPAYKPTPADVDMLMTALLEPHYRSSAISELALQLLGIPGRKMTAAEKDEALRTHAKTKSTPTFVALVVQLASAVAEEYRTDPAAYNWATTHGWTDPHPRKAIVNGHYADQDFDQDLDDDAGEQLSIDDELGGIDA